LTTSIAIASGIPCGNIVTLNATIPIVIGSCVRPAANLVRGTRSRMPSSRCPTASQSIRPPSRISSHISAPREPSFIGGLTHLKAWFAADPMRGTERSTALTACSDRMVAESRLFYGLRPALRRATSFDAGGSTGPLRRHASEQ
jgi:hypothetical protein